MARKTSNTAVLEPPAAPQNSDDPVSMLAAKGKPCPELEPADFWRATKAYPRSAGTYYKLYRLFPVIDRRLVGETKKDIGNEHEMDEGWILSEFGAGDYQIYFYDHNSRPVSKASAILKLAGDLWERPPVLNQAELVEGHPKNKGYIEGLKARGLWTRDTQQQEQNNMAETAAVSAANTAVTELSGIAKSAMARANEKQPTDAALHQAVDIMGTAYKSALSTIGETGGKKGGGEMLLVIQMMQEQSQRQHEVFMELLKQQGARHNPAAGGGIDKEISVVQKMMEFAKTLAADQGGRPSSWLDRLPDLAVPLITGMMQRAAAPPPAPPQYPQYAPPSSLPVAAPPAAAPPAAPVQSDPSEDPMMPMILAQMGVPPEAVPFAKALLKIAGRAVTMFKAGVSGYAVAADVERTEGEETYGQIWAAGPVELVGLLSKFAPMFGPDNAAMISGAPFQAFLADFFAYGQQAGYADDDSDAEPAGADAGVAE